MQHQSRSKQHHYVPQNHLRRFAATNDQIYVFDKTTGNHFPSSVKNVGGETNFSGTQEVEAELAKADGKFKAIVDEVLLNLENGKFTPDHKRVLAPYIALQTMRTREMQDTISELGMGMVLEIAQRAGRPIDLSRFKVKMNPTYVKYIHLMTFLDPDRRRKLAQYLYMEYIWFVGVNETGLPLWTSDAPIVVKSHSKKGETWQEKGMLSAAERWFALTPKYMLILLMRRFAKHLEDKEGGIIRLTEQQVIEHNLLQVSQCTRQVYSPTTDFTIAEKFRREFPEACDSNRQRVRMDSSLQRPSMHKLM